MTIVDEGLSVNLRMGFASDEFGYLIDLGLPSSGSSTFGLDPEWNWPGR